ncbi:MAG: TetR/AcrR family transcriptional regulator [Desulfamplus sp.]|nr:TetR/AcrR family transcriptional regulator [Desulfamplus sp.]
MELEQKKVCLPEKSFPPGKIKIMNALSELMREKDFHSITTADIAATAGVTEGLIYKYFKDKKDLLYQVLNGHFQTFQHYITRKIAAQTASVDKLRIIIKTSLKSYAVNRVFARILLLEVRNSSNYFESDAYDMVKIYSRTILDIISQGIDAGEIREDVDPHALRQVILGSIEHACLGEVIFGKELDIDKVSENICNIIFKGVQK